NNELASTIDLLPTLAAASGAKLPAEKIDGVNLLPLLRGEDVTPRTEFYYYYKRNDLEAVRRNEWKLVFPHKYRSYEDVLPGKDGYPGPYKNGSLDSLALYDLRRDPGERYNVIEMYPDIVEQLQQLADKARRDLGDDLTGEMGQHRRPIGRIVNN